MRKKLGNRIRELRLEKNITQEGMEEGPYGIPLGTFKDIERGKSNSTISSLVKIALRLGVKPKDLLDFK
ncbi:helix-turn-helix domain-containing protein [Leptospira koniambonensis]|uniref:helix-turn-helix domain-containing protein n=1 Tax=Leptospira koniambonensis TaxID=2484950 RepID=UPI001FC9E9C7|nr:helix-turn-helix transcriptional regulator [Leptospira koniambonensis]